MGRTKTMRGICDAEVASTLQITQDTVSSLQVDRTRVRKDLGEFTNSKTDVWASPVGEM
jgi:hypothetical protein